MPIDYKKYPPNWKQIRQRILERADNKCECCGLENKSFALSYKKNGVTVWEQGTFESWLKNDLPKRVKVVLTIAHLDHDETNHDVKDDRLKAMCQLCHLRYDAEEKSKRRLNKMKKEKLYFRSIDDNICHSLDWHIEDAKLEELEEITLVEAIPDNDNNDYVWCTHYENTEEKSLCSKNNCPAYSSKSGRGVCEHRGNLFTFGDEVTFSVLQDNS